MKIKNIIHLVSLGTLAHALVKNYKSSKKKVSDTDLEKISKYKKYLEDKDFVIVDRKNYKKRYAHHFSVSSLPKYYAIAKTIYKIVKK